MEHGARWVFLNQKGAIFKLDCRVTKMLHKFEKLSKLIKNEKNMLLLFIQNGPLCGDEVTDIQNCIEDERNVIAQFIRSTLGGVLKLALLKQRLL